MKLLDLLKELGAMTGMKPQDITLDAEGRCTLTVQGNIHVTIEESPDGSTALLSSVLCRYPGTDTRMALFDLLLEAHAFGLGTDDAYFGASAGMGSVFLFKRLPLEDLQAEVFGRALVSFVGTYAFWKNEYDSGTLGGLKTAGAAAQAGSAAPGVFA